ncbi:MAG: ParB/RepB/Spo0J family partition protein [Candidatus Brennerbacteria bacterium]|nr:ParB/RepB/Spo0J family partition protein [Candidatus Brennerbacteria bacterium]
MLGKGLESLLPKKTSVSTPRVQNVDSAPAVQDDPDSLRGGFSPNENHARRPAPHHISKFHEDAIFQIEVDKIKPNPYQPRGAFDEEALEGLAGSIREFGVLQPLVVTKKVEETPAGTLVAYELVAGERRLLAAKRAGLERVPAIVKALDSHRAKLEIALIENIQRSNLSPLEAARAYARLQEEFGLTQREIGARMGKSRETVANTLRLLQLSAEELEALASGTITESHARVLLSVAEPAARRALFVKFFSGRSGTRPRRKAAVHIVSPEDVATARALEEKLGAPVKVTRRGAEGTIEIIFYSDEEYRGLRDRLLGEEA